jgi:RNA polymerase sigma-70 factor (ECF subfamily)
VGAAQAGDRAALETLLDRHFGRLRGLCRRMCGNDADADDATQEALIAVVRGLGAFDGRSAFATWAHRVATNACLDELRRRSRRPAPWADPEAAAPVGTGPVGNGPAVNQLGAGPDLAAGVVDRLDLDAALATLAPEVRAAVVLRDLCGYDYAGIAEILDIPAGTVRSRISRGRARLVTLLDHGNPKAVERRPTSDDGDATTPSGGSHG